MSRDGDILVPRHMQAAPDPFLTAVAPDRDGLVVAVAGLFPWYGRADRWAQERMPCVRGHALSRQAIPGGKGKHDTLDSHQSAARRRGGRWPQAYVDPAEMRATRDLLRRRTHLMRKRAEL